MEKKNYWKIAFANMSIIAIALVVCCGFLILWGVNKITFILACVLELAALIPIAFGILELAGDNEVFHYYRRNHLIIASIVIVLSAIAYVTKKEFSGIFLLSSASLITTAIFLIIAKVDKVK